MRHGLPRALLISQAIALLWWTIAFYARSKPDIVVWLDQRWTFLQAWPSLRNPYQLVRLANPPWALIPLIPFSFMPVPLATLIQLCLYFALLTALIFKYGGAWRAVLLTLISYIALDNAIELNIDWIVCIGLLIPVPWNMPFLLVKPQEALGVLASYPRRTMIHAVLGALLVILCALLIWGDWPLRMWNAIRVYALGGAFNLAPITLIPAPLSIAIGFTLLSIAYKKRDPIRGIWGWLFIAPYTTLYALLLPFALLTIRHPRLALLISVVMWVIYGSLTAFVLLHS